LLWDDKEHKKMKQIWPNYSYSPATNVLTLTGLNIDRDQLLLVTAADRGRIMYNFADSSVTASAFTSGANTALTLVATTAGLTTTAALVIYYDDQLQSTAVSISNFPASQVISGTVTANPTGTQTIAGTVTANGGNFAYAQDEDTSNPSDRGVLIGWRDDANGSFRNTSDAQPLPISGTVSLGIQQSDDSDANIKFLPIGFAQSDGGGMLDYWAGVKQTNPLPVYLPSTYSLPAGTNRIGVVTIGAGTVTIGAGTAQIGSVTASISGTVPISISSVTVGNSVTIGSLPAISGTVTANTFALQGTAVTTSNFTSTTASTVLASYNATREVLTIFNEGAGNLHIAPGATCTTIAYQVRLSAGDYYEVPNHQTTITHSAVFATAGTARVTEVS
jgi:hypothetical protein